LELRETRGPISDMGFPTAGGATPSGASLDVDDTGGKTDQDRGEGRAHSRKIIFLMVEVAVPRELFRANLERIGRLKWQSRWQGEDRPFQNHGNHGGCVFTSGRKWALGEQKGSGIPHFATE
jgi:hypothetical protein